MRGPSAPAAVEKSAGRFTVVDVDEADPPSSTATPAQQPLEKPDNQNLKLAETRVGRFSVSEIPDETAAAVAHGAVGGGETP